jgi:hypothetical protein
MTDPQSTVYVGSPESRLTKPIALSVCAPVRSRAPTPTTPCSRSSADCCHATCIVAYSGAKKAAVRASALKCAHTASLSAIFVVDRTAERTRTNANPCHPCHARPSPRVCHRGGLRPLPRRTVRRPVDDDIRRSGRRSPPHPRTAVRSRAAAASSCSKAGSMSSIAAASRPFAAAI